MSVSAVSNVHFLVDNNEDLEDSQSHSNQHESEDLTASVGYDESIVDVSGALFGSSDVCVDGNPHTDPA